MATMEQPASAPRPRLNPMRRAALWIALAAAPAWAADPLLAPALSAALEHQASERALAAWPAPPPLRVQVSLGRLDPRLQLAPCARIEPFAPAGVPAWGATRVGLRCAEGVAAWKVTLPATVQVYVRGLVALAALPPGTTISQGQLASAEVDAAARSDGVLVDPAQALGRVLARALAPGEALHRGDLRVRQWFAAGDMVRIVASGAGWSVSTEGRAIGAGVEGQAVSARTENGRTVTGYATGDHRLEVAM